MGESWDWTARCCALPLRLCRKKSRIKLVNISIQLSGRSYTSRILLLIVRLKVSWLYKRYNLFKEIIDKSPSHEDYARLSDPLERGCIKRQREYKEHAEVSKTYYWKWDVFCYARHVLRILLHLMSFVDVLWLINEFVISFCYYIPVENFCVFTIILDFCMPCCYLRSREFENPNLFWRRWCTVYVGVNRQ